MKHTNDVNNSLTRLSKRILKASQSLSKIADLYTVAYKVDSSDLLKDVNAFKVCTDKISDLCNLYAAQKIPVELRTPFTKIHIDGSELYNVRNAIKTNYSMYKKFSDEFDIHFNKNSDEYILNNLRENVEKHYQIYTEKISVFIEATKKLSSRMKIEETKAIFKFSQFEHEFITELTKIYKDINSYNPDYYVASEVFVNIDEEKDDESNVKVQIDTDCPSLDQL
ncbi:hypothetical protein TVAG_265560 [Trichomonas vaginalis G3]|uniref:Uncharacterized protein n=1 Tax=Trichomonas vaginalis (strain ATCC PRA-98 / G3) TaxID=412133 RepID=A2FGC1_TRIV3|nr:hypothetical protein TVAGG3_0623210 [Trichomonas vaginalis G3]EAX96067.1 hypothetical protein TVAG_265560 [Trichomonas vaginalis G3]KAI5504011.1 hypothetical protein TVAGG3_0623210 [Trichomonas vaginalis G3]|eukprot:XP_001308997.1 hypothetical protein [Trichomonas vaginalis G3]